MKDRILPEQSRNVAKFAFSRKKQRQIWKVNGWAENRDVARCPTARQGADLCNEERVDKKLFLSDARWRKRCLKSA